MSGLTVNSGNNTVQTNSTPVMQDWAFNPEAISIIYYQGQPMPAAQVVATQLKDMIGLTTTMAGTNFQYRLYAGIAQGASTNHILISGTTLPYTGAQWAEYVNGMSGNMTYSFQVLNILSPGTYTFPVYHQIRATFNGIPQIIAERTLYIKITVYPSTAPSLVTPDGLNFVRTIGSLVDVLKQVQVNSATFWSLSVPYGFGFTPVSGVTIVQTSDGGHLASGTGNKVIHVVCSSMVEPLVIVQNPMPFTLAVNGGQQTLPMTVTFVGSSGLFLQYTSLHYIGYKGISEAAPKTVAISYPGNYTIVLPPFITGPVSGQNNGIYTFTALSTANLAAGQYTGKIKVYRTSDNAILGNIEVVYDVIGNILSPYRPRAFAFTLDDEYITLTSELENTYYDVVLKADIYDYYASTFNQVSFPFKVRLFQKKQIFSIGDIIHKLMKGLPHFEDTVQDPYVPAVVSLELTEKSDSDPDYSLPLQLNNIKFVAGRKPKLEGGNGILDLNPEPSRITASGYTYLNLLVGGYLSSLHVYRYRGSAVTPVSSSHISVGIKTVKVDMAALEAAPGDIFEFRLQTGSFDFDPVFGEENVVSVSKFYKVFPDAMESNYIIWENEYKLRSCIEFTGDFTVKSEFDNRNQSLMDRLKEVLVKLESNKSSKLTINTGYLLKSDKPSIESLCRAKRAALVFPDGKIINLVPIQKSIVNVDNKQELIDFDIEFEINREFNEEIYSF